MTNPNPIALPGNGILRVSISDYNGTPEIDVRRWFRGSDGAEHATRQGVRVPPDAAEAFLRSVTEAVGALKAKPARTSKAKPGRTSKPKAKPKRTARPAEDPAADALAEKIHARLAERLGVSAEDVADLIG